MNDLKEIGGFIVSADPYVNHDNSLSGNGTLTSPLGVVPGYNETVLYSGAASSAVALSESYSGFERIALEIEYWPLGAASIIHYEYPTNQTSFTYVAPWVVSKAGGMAVFEGKYSATDTTHLVLQEALYNNMNGNTQNTWVEAKGSSKIHKVVGINRKQ